MGLSFNYPFELGDSNSAIKSDIAQLQQDVGDLSQLDTVDKSSLVNALNEAIDSTLNGASRNLDNLSDEGNEKLYSLNVYKNEGSILHDAKGLEYVTAYSHSTFDLSKFTVVGSPNITDDGIASGFSSSNVVRANVDAGSANIIEFDGSFEYTAKSAVQAILQFANSLYRFAINSSNNIVARFQNSAGTWYEDITVNPSDYNITEGTKVYYKILLYKTEGYRRLYISTDGINYTKVGTDVVSTNTVPFVDNLSLYYGASWGTPSYIEIYQGSMDLKDICVKLDGIEVFSGNKTGIDTVKADDYTIYPTSDSTVIVTDDGVARGFTDSKYIKTNQSIPVDKDFVLEFEYIVTQDFLNKYATSQQYLIGGTYNSGNDAIPVLFEHTSQNYKIAKFSLTVDNNGTNQTFALNSAQFNVVLGDKIKAVLSRKNGIYKAQYYKNGIQIGNDVTSVNTNNLVFESNLIIGQFKTNFTFQSWKGSIDLNSFKIYVDGDLIYQPCLKIPYTESKTGSKIVDSIYRDRVNDMAEQFGYAPYYTLDEENGNFTLPQVELYGLIGQRTLRDSYRNGINYWDLYSNRDLEQGGSCTSGVEVTFARPFADTNYVLSVPYSAKSATAFTPTQTGDWIAKGKGIL